LSPVIWQPSAPLCRVPGYHSDRLGGLSTWAGEEPSLGNVPRARSRINEARKTRFALRLLASLLDNALRIYAWFLLIVTVLPAAARLARPRELARILLLRYQNPARRKRARIGGFIFLSLSILAMPFAIRAQRAESRWLIIALLVGVVSSLEFLLDSRLFEEESLTRQNRYFGGVYASIAIATILLLMTR